MSAHYPIDPIMYGSYFDAGSSIVVYFGAGAVTDFQNVFGNAVVGALVLTHKVDLTALQGFLEHYDQARGDTFAVTWPKQDHITGTVQCAYERSPTFSPIVPGLFGLQNRLVYTGP